MVNLKHHDWAAFQMLHVTALNLYCMQAKIFILINGFIICFLKKILTFHQWFSIHKPSLNTSSVKRDLLKETQTFKVYKTESCKYYTIIAGTNTKVLKTHGLLNKILFSICHSLCLLWLVLPVAFFNGRVFSFLEHSTLRIFNITNDHSCCI